VLARISSASFHAISRCSAARWSRRRHFSAVSQSRTQPSSRSAHSVARALVTSLGRVAIMVSRTLAHASSAVGLGHTVILRGLLKTSGRGAMKLWKGLTLGRPPLPRDGARGLPSPLGLPPPRQLEWQA
jgi:hypothetical protein